MKAFPQAQFRGDEPVDTEEHGGMDLRDYFAAKAMQLIPFMANEVFRNPETWGEKEIAEECYRIADAMMEERNE